MQVLSVISPMDHEATEELSSSAKSSVRNYTSAMDQGSNAIDQHCQMEQRTEKTDDIGNTCIWNARTEKYFLSDFLPQ
ncbi:hypothetical protein CEXT_15181 [Caerostris extrusa]|uniref:Uncharacterized protein n=1 Tax=Caerostris extrusa TaxID=172846 RepID=A0AAV4WWK4_CAEEX|nr:hypothetical protein CEXT_15181 [Caerostris extrusa]